MPKVITPFLGLIVVLMVGMGLKVMSMFAPIDAKGVKILSKASGEQEEE